MLLELCAWQVDEYSFKIKDTTPQESYDDASIDRDTFTNMVLTVQKINSAGETLTLDVTGKMEYIYSCDGSLVNFSDFGEDTFNEYDYFVDWLYTFTLTYTYNGTEYSSSVTSGFHALISRVVYQKTQQADWKTELACDCDCENYSSILRIWHYLQMMGVAAELCLNNQWFAMMKALYKITGTTHEFADEL